MLEVKMGDGSTAIVAAIPEEALTKDGQAPTADAFRALLAKSLDLDPSEVEMLSTLVHSDVYDLAFTAFGLFLKQEGLLGTITDRLNCMVRVVREDPPFVQMRMLRVVKLPMKKLKARASDATRTQTPKN